MATEKTSVKATNEMQSLQSQDEIERRQGRRQLHLVRKGVNINVDY
jgi:hypothetical protein